MRRGGGGDGMIEGIIYRGGDGGVGACKGRASEKEPLARGSQASSLLATCRCTTMQAPARPTSPLMSHTSHAPLSLRLASVRVLGLSLLLSSSARARSPSSPDGPCTRRSTHSRDGLLRPRKAARVRPVPPCFLAQLENERIPRTNACVPRLSALGHAFLAAPFLSLPPADPSVSLSLAAHCLSSALHRSPSPGNHPQPRSNAPTAWRSFHIVSSCRGTLQLWQ